MLSLVCNGVCQAVLMINGVHLVVGVTAVWGRYVPIRVVSGAPSAAQGGAVSGLSGQVV